MKTKLIKSISAACILFLELSARGQGNLVYDQQSFDRSIPPNITFEIQSKQPMGQSFIPTLSSVGFVQLELGDAIGLDGIGATVHVNLLANSITGTILGSSDPVVMPDNFFGDATFFFATPVGVSPGTTYYFQPIVESGDTWRVNTLLGPFYPNGTAYFNGAPATANYDLWFREGVVVPEPSAAWLILVGVGVFVYVRGRHIKNCSLR